MAKLVAEDLILARQLADSHDENCDVALSRIEAGKIAVPASAGSDFELIGFTPFMRVDTA